MALGGTIKIKGESEYRRALSQIKQNLREVSSEMKIVTSTYDKNDTSTGALTAKSGVLTKRLEEQKSKLKLVSEQYKKYEEAVKKSADEHEQLGTKLESAKSELERIRKTTGETSTEYEKQKKVVDDLQKEYDDSTKAQDVNAKSLSNLKIELNGAQADVNKTTKALDELGNEAEDSGKKAKDLGDGFTVMKGALSNLVSQGITSAINGIKSLSRSVFEAGESFESGMSEVSAISGATGDDLQALTDKAKEMGAKTKFTATESAEAFKYMAMAGWKTSDMLNGISGVMNLASASGEDLGQVSDIVTDALTAMGYSAGDAGHFADVLASASSNSNTNVGLMGATFQYVAPIAGAMKYNIEDLAVAIGLMANAGIKGEKSGTALRSILTRLSTPPKECAEAMKALGINIQNTDGTMKPLNEVMGELRKSFSGLSDAQKTQYAKSIAGQEAMSGLLAIVNASPADYDKLSKAIDNCSGASEQMANKMNDNVSGQITLLKSKVEGIMIKIFDDASGSIKDAIKKISEALDSIDWNAVADTIGKAMSKAVDIFEWIIDNKEIIVTALSAIVAGFTAFKAVSTVQKGVKAFMDLKDGIKEAKTAFELLNVAFAGSGIGLIIAGVVALVAGFVTLWNTSESFRNFWIGLWDGIKEVTGTVVNAIVGFFTQTLPNGFNAVIEFFANLPGNIANFLGQTLTNVGQWVVNMVQKAGEVGSQFLQNVVSFFSQLPYNIGYLIGEALGFIIKWVPQIASMAIQAGSQFLHNVVSFFSQLPSNIWNFLTNVISNVAGWVVNMAGKARNAGSQFLQNVISFFRQLPSNVAKFLSNVISNLGSWAGNMARKGAEGARNLFHAVVNGIKNLPKEVMNIGKNIVQGIWDGISGAAGWLAGKVKSFAKGILDGMKDALKIHSPSRVFRDEVGKYIAEGIGVGFTDEMKSVTADMINAIPTNFDVDANVKGSSGYVSSDGYSYDRLVSAFKDALSQVKIEMDDEEMGHFVDKTVTKLIYD